MNHKAKTGIKFALGTALISGLANFFNKELLITGIDSVSLVFIKNSLVGIGLLIITALSFRKLPKINLKDSWKFLTIALVGGSISFLLFFKGLSLTTAATGSLIHKTMFLWVALLAFIFLNEKFKKYQLAALSVLSLGIILLSKTNAIAFGAGELMMFVATLLWSLEIIFVKKFLKDIDFKILATSRMLLGSVFILGFASWQGQMPQILTVSSTNWLKILIVSGFLFGYVFTWYKSLSLAPANLVTSILTLAFPITILSVNLKQANVPSATIILGLIFFVVAIFLLLKPYLKERTWKKPLTQN